MIVARAFGPRGQDRWPGDVNLRPSGYQIVWPEYCKFLQARCCRAASGQSSIAKHRSRSVGNRRNGGTAGKVRIPEGRLPVPRGNELRAIEVPRTNEIGARKVGTV